MLSINFNLNFSLSFRVFVFVFVCVCINMCTAAASTPITPHQVINEEEINSIASSPSSSQGPLSPKTPTTMKSTSQVSPHYVEIHSKVSSLAALITRGSLKLIIVL